MRRTEGGSTVWKWMIAMAGVGTAVVTLIGCATAPTSREGKTDLDRDVQTALAKAKAQDPSLQAFLDQAHGYAIFPSVGKGAVGVGGAYGRGLVFERGRKIGYCDLSQATIGVQLGGQVYTEIIAFESQAGLDNFKNGNLRFAGQATAVALKAGAGSNAQYTDGVRVLTAVEEGRRSRSSRSDPPARGANLPGGRGRARRRAMRRTCVAAVSLALAAAVHPALAQRPSAVPPSPAETVSRSPAAFGVLTGRWVRPDGGYVITVNAVDAGGRLEASYANPKPLPFYTAEVTRDGNALKVFFELRAGGYNGSTYTLHYDAATDQLRGVYYQAVARQKFEVVFVRAK